MTTGPEKTVLVTGGLGYIGGRAVFHLAKTGWNVIRTTRRPVGDMPLPGLPNIRTIQWDPTGSDTPDLSAVNAIIHLASANEIVSGTDPLRAVDDTVKGTINLLAAAEKYQVPSFLYMSTIHVYGSPLENVIDESCLPRPVHPYAITHKAAEDFVLAARDRTGINALVLRLSNSYGAPATPDVDRWSLLVNDLCRKVMETGRLTLRSHGLQKRDFITLTDVCRALGHGLSLDKSETLDGIFNLGGKKTLSVIEMTRLIAGRYERLTGKKAIIERPPPPVTELLPDKDFSFSIKKLKSTGFNLEGMPEDELDIMLRFCQEHFTELS